MSDRRIAVVTGGNRGLGLETCRQLAARAFGVVLTARGVAVAREAADRLGVEHVQLDVENGTSVERAVRDLRDRHGRIDVLVNNAGIALDGFDADVARKTIAVNLFGTIGVTEAIRAILSGHASIVMVSSGLGELSRLSPQRRRDFEAPDLTTERLVELMHEFIRDVEQGTYAASGWPESTYSVSKVGLNVYTRILARELAGTGILVNAVCPGWVRTDMGGAGATRSVEEGASSIVWAATLPPDGPTGGFFRDGKSIAW